MSTGPLPYKLAARLYAELGWSPVPLPHKEKSPPPDTQPFDPKTPLKDRPEKGGHPYTGAGANPVTEEDLALWLAPRGRATAGDWVYPVGNICLRLPEGFEVEGEPGLWDVIGVDVDDYEGKDGAATLRRAEDRWGPLPATWVAGNRVGDTVSGIRLLRVPHGLTWPGNLEGAADGGLGGGVDLVRAGHRYVIVAPSLHDKKPNREYWWRDPSGAHLLLSQVLTPEAAAEGGADVDLPAPGELPRMPEEWVAGLAGEEGASGRGTSRRGAGGAGGRGKLLSEAEVKAWLAERDDAVGTAMCTEMERTLVKYQRKVREAGEDGGAHDAARDGAWALIGDAAAGHAGVTVALGKLKAAFLRAVDERVRAGGTRGERLVAGEWKSIVLRGVTKISGEGEPEDEDSCAVLTGSNAPVGGTRAKGHLRSVPTGAEVEPSDDDIVAAATAAAKGSQDTAKPVKRRKAGLPKAGERGASAFEYEWSHDGNALRLRRQLSGEVLWCEAIGGWHRWVREQGRWLVDPESLWIRNQTSIMRADMRLDAEYIENEKAKETFLKFIVKCGSISEQRGMVEALKQIPGISVDESSFDANPFIINCPNGVIELSPSRLARPEGDPVTFRPVSPDDYVRLTTGVPYKQGATHEAWDKFLDRFMPDPEVRTWAQKVAAYSLLGDNRSRVLVICKGPTSTGKTTFAEAVMGALGGYADSFGLSLFRDNQDERPRPDIVGALPKRLIVAEETSAAWKLHADQIKRATGGGRWRARGMFGKSYVQRVPAFVPWIVTNNTPTIEGADAALVKRLRAIPFLHQVPSSEEMVSYKEVLSQPEVKEAILAWIVEGWGAYLDDDTLTDAPRQALESLATMVDEFSELHEFLAEACAKDAEYRVPFPALFAAYEGWMRDNNSEERDILTKNKFGRVITEMGFPAVTGWNAGTKKTDKFRVGLKLNDQYSAMYSG